MLPLRYARFWRIGSLLLLAAVLVAALAPADWLFGADDDQSSWFPHADKVLHGVTFLLLATWFAGQYRHDSYWRIAIGLLAFGALIELCQLMTGYRTADWIDMGANTAGIIAGLGLALTGAGGWCQRVEAWQLAREA